MTGSASPDGTGTQTEEVRAALSVIRKANRLLDGVNVWEGKLTRAASVLSAEIERLTRRAEELQGVIDAAGPLFKEEYRCMTKGHFDNANRVLAKTVADNIILTARAEKAEAALASAAAPDERKERIVRAAIKWGEAVYSVPRPGRHGDVYRLIEAERSLEDDPGPNAQGFLTSTGRFVRRIEARDLARQAGQLLPETKPHHELFSEDVWRTPIRTPPHE